MRNPGVGGMSSHLYKERKGGPAAFFVKVGTTRSDVTAFLSTHDCAGVVSNHPRRYCGTSELHFITWSGYRSYAFGKRVRINQWG
jgi:hypothetical protein